MGFLIFSVPFPLCSSKHNLACEVAPRAISDAVSVEAVGFGDFRLTNLCIIICKVPKIARMGNFYTPFGYIGFLPLWWVCTQHLLLTEVFRVQVALIGMNNAPRSRSDLGAFLLVFLLQLIIFFYNVYNLC